MLFVFTGFSTGGYAQEINYLHRDLPVTIRNSKARPVKDVFVASHHTGKAGLTNRSGRFVFKSLSVEDTISIELPNYGVVVIPIAGMDSIEVTVPAGNRNRFSFTKNFRQNATIERSKARTGNVYDVQELSKNRSYESLFELLRLIESGKLWKTDARTLLVILDGVILGTAEEANSMINVNDIKTIELKRDFNEWGSRGRDGVLLISTR